MSGPYKGSCLCGVIRFEVDEFGPTIGNCHCSMCRKFHGAAYATLADVDGDKFRWLAGEDALQAYVAPNGTTRRFCKHCGSSLTFASPRASDNVVEIALGAFDSDLPLVPDAHIFVDSAANWTAIDDRLPRFAQGRNSAKSTP